MFDKREHAETVLKKFEDAVGQLQSTTLRIRSMYGEAVLNLDYYSGAVLGNLSEGEELMISLGVRRARVEQKAREEFEAWVKTRKNLITGALGPVIKKPQH